MEALCCWAPAIRIRDLLCTTTHRVQIFTGGSVSVFQTDLCVECAGAFPLTTFLGVCSAEVSSEYCLLIGAKLREKEQGSSAMPKSIHRIFFLICPLSVVAIGVWTKTRNAWQQEPGAQPGRVHYSRVGVAIARQKPLGIRPCRPFRREHRSACRVGGNRAEPGRRSMRW